MPLTDDEIKFKKWIESENCVNYWVYDHDSQQPKLISGWKKAQAEYDRIKEKETQPKDKSAQ